jgi:hypothetical protein
MQGEPQLGEHALRSLANHHAGHKEIDDALKFSTTLITRTNAALDDRLQHLALLHQAKKPEFDGYVAQLQQRAATNAQQVFALASQLLALDQAQKTLTWLKSLPNEIQSEQPVPLAFADTLARLKDWRGMEERLNGERWKDQDHMRLALMAYAVRQQNDEAVAKVHWDKAVQLALDRPERLMVLVQMAANWRWDAEADALLWRVVKNFPREQWAIDTLHSAYMRTRNTRGLYSVYSTLMERDSTNRMVMNNYASVALLLGTNLSRAHELAKRVYEVQTNNSVFISTYAWSLHLQGKSAEALQVMEAIPTAQLADPSFAGYYGALLVANGQKEKAKQYLEKAATAALLPEEKTIAEEAKRKL